MYSCIYKQKYYPLSSQPLGKNQFKLMIFENIYLLTCSCERYQTLTTFYPLLQYYSECIIFHVIGGFFFW